MSKKIIISESQLSRIVKNLIENYDSFYQDENLSSLRNAIDRNKTVSVAFVKKDGTVRHMAVRKYLSSYEASQEPKTDAQLNVQENNDLKRVVDINVYKKELRALKIAEPNAELDDLRKKASKKAWRSINLTTVLGFLVGGRFIDLREENDIMGRFGPEVYSQLTQGMIDAMEEENVPPPPQQNPEENQLD